MIKFRQKDSNKTTKSSSVVVGDEVIGSDGKEYVVKEISLISERVDIFCWEIEICQKKSMRLEEIKK